jgi:hypothetical protein
MRSCCSQEVRNRGRCADVVGEIFDTYEVYLSFAAATT